MAVTVHLSGYLKPFSSGETEVTLEKDLSTVEAVLENLWARHPALRDRVLTETGDIRQHVNIFVGSEDVKRKQGLQTLINANDIHIFNAVSGG